MRIVELPTRVRGHARASARMAGWLAAAALLVAAGGVGTTVHAADARREPLSAFPKGLLSIRTPTGRVLNFRIWVADTPARAEQGLMFVRRVGDHDGMLFPFSGRQPIAMWMKNTYVSLDMLFVDRRGRISAIAKRTKPLSLDLIDAPAGTRAVVELRGGICERLGIGVGDAVLSDALTSGT